MFRIYAEKTSPNNYEIPESSFPLLIWYSGFTSLWFAALFERVADADARYTGMAAINIADDTAQNYLVTHPHT